MSDVNLTNPNIKYITIEGQPIRYEVTGQGRSLILMHGWGCNLTTVRSIANVAAQTHTVYNIDFPGFGESPEPDEIWGVEKYTQLIEKFARELNIERPVLIGHSFGGRVGIVYASRNEVDKLILVNAAGVKPRHKPKYYIKVYSYKTAKWLMKTFLPKDEAEIQIAKMRDKKGSADYRSASQKMKTIMSKVVNEDLCDKMPNIKAPTLLIWGAKDTATPIKDAKTMEKLIPDAGLVVFEDAGHYSFLDNPFGFAKVLSYFLNNTSKEK